MPERFPSIPWLHDLRRSEDAQTAYVTESTFERTELLCIDLQFMKITKRQEIDCLNEPEEPTICRIFDSLEEFRTQYKLNIPEKPNIQGIYITEGLCFDWGTLYLSLDENGQHLCCQRADTVSELKSIPFPMPKPVYADSSAVLWTGEENAPLLVCLPGTEAGDSCPAFRLLLQERQQSGYHILWLRQVTEIEAAEAAIHSAMERVQTCSVALFGTHLGASLACELIADRGNYAALILVNPLVNPVGRLGINPEIQAQDVEELWKHSALSKAKRFQVPALLFVNPGDYRFGMDETQQMFQVLVEQNTPARMIVLHENGPFLVSEDNRRCFLAEAKAWLERYAQGGGKGV